MRFETGHMARGTVLVVDDQERNVQVVGSTLAGAGFEVMAALSGEQALTRIKARRPDLILLDILMSGMDGFEVCSRLQEGDTASIPIIFLSAADESDVIVQALEAGGVDYITKPFNRAELLARVRTHVELKQARDTMEKLLRQRDEFLAMIAHDLKNPLGGAQFSAQLLGEMTDGISEKALKLAAAARDGIGRALELVEGFLEDTKSALEEVEITADRIDLVRCVEDAVTRHLQAATRKSIKLDWARPADPVTVLADPVALGRILDNLISNALKFSPNDSTVWISLDPETAEVRVRDEGPGFTEEDRSRLFESFSRLSARPTGGEPSTGLGLNIAKRLSDEMGAALKLLPTNPEKPGAEFALRLPSAHR